MPKTAIKTLEAIDKHILESQDDEHRTHLGASLIGTECSRKIWYIFHWAKAEQFESRVLRLFERGQREESVFVGFLKAIGVEVWEINPSDGKQWRIADVDGHFGGSLDGVGQGLPDLPPKEPFLCEFKTHNDKSFNKLKTDGLMRTKWQHFIQMQVYMYKMNLRYGVYFAVNKNDDELFIEIVEVDIEQGQRAIARAREVIFSEIPLARISPKPSFWQCKFCHFQRLCHFGDVVPDRNCRTCVFASPSDEGFWRCGYIKGPKNGLLNKQDQHEGCKFYTVNPMLQGRQP